MTIVIVFRTGFELKIKCKEFNMQKSSVTGLITGYSAKGITENKPIYFELSDVLCIYRV